MFAGLVALLAVPAAAAGDGRHDFDFELGTWSMAPSGNIHVVRKLWDGATIAQLVVPAPAPHVRGSLLSLYDPSAHLWNVYWADANDGSLSKPLTGGFRNGIGTFIGPDTRAGRSILVRVVYDRITAHSFRTVQSESTDGGRTWKNAVTWTYIKKRSIAGEAALQE